MVKAGALAVANTALGTSGGFRLELTLLTMYKSKWTKNFISLLPDSWSESLTRNDFPLPLGPHGMMTMGWDHYKDPQDDVSDAMGKVAKPHGFYVPFAEAILTQVYTNLLSIMSEICLYQSLLKTSFETNKVIETWTNVVKGLNLDTYGNKFHPIHNILFEMNVPVCINALTHNYNVRHGKAIRTPELRKKYYWDEERAGYLTKEGGFVFETTVAPTTEV